MRRLFVVLFLFLDACIDPLGVKVTGENTRLIVDGLITDQPGPHLVKLFYSNPLTTSRFLKPFEPVTAASVIVRDDLNNQYILYEVMAGVYSTENSGLIVTADREYKLLITTVDEKQYESSNEKLWPSGVIEDVSFGFVNNRSESSGEQIHSLKVYVNARGAGGENNFFRWRWTTVHKTISNPELRVKLTPGGEFPDPPGCSGYIVVGGGLVKVSDCTCCICWSYNYNDGARVSQNEYTRDNIFNMQYIGAIPVTAMHFFDKYHIAIEQLSLSESAYDFWRLIEKQQRGATDIFQPNMIKIRGNITSITDPNEEVLGFFGVSGIATKSFFIDRSVVPVDLPPLPIVPFSCLDYFKKPTTNRPEFW